MRPARLPRLALCLLLLVGCGGKDRAPRRSEGPAGSSIGKLLNPDPHASPYVRATEVAYACGWGKPGRTSGRSVYKDGRVEEWETEPDQEGRTVTKRWKARPDLAAAVFQAAQQVAFLDLEMTEHDDLGCTLDLVWPDGSHRVSWKEGKVPPHVTPVLRAISALRP